MSGKYKNQQVLHIEYTYFKDSFSTGKMIYPINTVLQFNLDLETDVLYTYAVNGSNLYYLLFYKCLMI